MTYLLPALRRALLLATLCAPLPAVAASDYPISGVAGLEILPGYEEGGRSFVAARIRLKPGWKTYWRAPGGNGVPPRFSFKGSENLASVAFHWPTPQVFDTAGSRTIGYAGELVLPIEITPRDPGQPVRIRGELEFGVCSDVCVPVTARFSLDEGAKPAADHARAIRDALAAQPRRLPSGDARCRVLPADGGLSLEARVTLPQARAGQFVVVEYPDPDVWVEPEPTTRQGTTLDTRATLWALRDAPLVLDRSRLRLTVLGDETAYEIVGCRAG